MESLEILKQELITQKAEIEQKGGTVSVASLNPSPSEITAGIKTISVPDLTSATATSEDVAEGKTFYSGDNTIKMGTQIVPDLSSATATEQDVIAGKTFYSGDNLVKTGCYEEIDVVSATADESDVVVGKTFFAGNKEIKTGTKIIADLSLADAAEENVEYGKTFYAGDNTLKTGNKIVPDLTLATATEQDVAEGKTFYAGSDEIKIGTKEESLNTDNSELYFKLFVSGEDYSTETFDFTLPNGLKKLKSHILYENANKNINFTFNTDLEEVDNYAFYKAENVTFTNFDQLNNIKRFGQYSFGWFPKLLDLENLSSVATYIDSRAFYNSIQENTSINLAKTLTYFGNYSFAKDTKTEMQSLIIPEDIALTSTGGYAFSNLLFDCDFKVPASLTTLAASFAYGSSFNNITIPSTCTSFGNGAFYMLKTEAASYRRLKTVTFEAETPPSFGTYPFAEQDKTNNFKIYVPDSAVDAYKADSKLSAYVDYIYPVSQKE